MLSGSLVAIVTPMTADGALDPGWVPTKMGGAGAPEFCEMLERFPTPQAFLDHVAENPVVVDQWQLEKLALVCRDKELLFYVPGLEARFRDKLWGRTFDSVNEALAATLDGLDAGARIAVIPEGPYVLARVEEGVLA